MLLARCLLHGVCCPSQLCVERCDGRDRTEFIVATEYPHSPPVTPLAVRPLARNTCKYTHTRAHARRRHPRAHLGTSDEGGGPRRGSAASAAALPRGACRPSSRRPLRGRAEQHSRRSTRFVFPRPTGPQRVRAAPIALHAVRAARADGPTGAHAHTSAARARRPAACRSRLGIAPSLPWRMIGACRSPARPAERAP